jgi:hypothetical protein
MPCDQSLTPRSENIWRESAGVCQIGYVDHTGCHSRGVSDWFMDRTGCHQLVQPYLLPRDLQRVRLVLQLHQHWRVHANLQRPRASTQGTLTHRTVYTQNGLSHLATPSFNIPFSSLPHRPKHRTGQYYCSAYQYTTCTWRLETHYKEMEPKSVRRKRKKETGVLPRPLPSPPYLRCARVRTWSCTASWCAPGRNGARRV